LAQGRKTGKSAKPENNDWIEPLMRRLEAGINKHTTVKLEIKTENSKLSLEIKKRKKAVCMPATGQRHSGSADDSEIYGYP
jgi:hypothetical protein